MEHDQAPIGPVEGSALVGFSGTGPPPALMAAGCPVCGLALPRFGRCPNRWCRRSDRGFSVVFAVGVHEGALRHAILRYKYRREMWWADVFARLFANYLRIHAPWFEEFDLADSRPRLHRSAAPGGSGIRSARSQPGSTTWSHQSGRS